jgi:hypothetical protein
MARKLIVGTTLVVVIGVLSAGIAVAAGGGGDDRPLTGALLEKASTATLEHVGAGTVVETEFADDGAAYSVEVRLADGTQVEVNLAEDFTVIGQETDDDGPGDEDGQGDR